MYAALRFVRNIRSLQTVGENSLRCEHIKRLCPNIASDTLEVIKKMESSKELSHEQYAKVLNIQIDESNPQCRHLLFQLFKDHRQFEMIAQLSNIHLLKANGGFTNDISIMEIKTYIDSLIRTSRYNEAVEMVKRFISQFSLSGKLRVVNLINSTFDNIYTVLRSDLAILMWVQMVKQLYGHFEFLGANAENSNIIRSLSHYSRSFSDFDENCIKALPLIEAHEGTFFASQFASTLIDFFARRRKYEKCKQVWKHIVKNKLLVTPASLTAIMATYCHFKEWVSVTEVYEKYTSARDEFHQFDYKLIAHARQQQWEDLRNQFNSLFRIGELPNIEHYGITMYALSDLGELELVEKLYSQLLRRGMIPNYPVLQSMVNVYYRVGDWSGATRHFELFQMHDLAPTPSTYLLMLKVYRQMDNLDACFKILKRMAQDGLDMWESHFCCVIDLCARSGNHAIAHELFDLMKSHYRINPTGSSISSLMEVYNSAKMPQNALKLFKKYRDSNISNINMIYNSALGSYMESSQYDKYESLVEEIMKTKTKLDSVFYLKMLRYLAEYKKDYESAEAMLDELLKSKVIKVRAAHFEVLISQYDKIGYTTECLDLFKKLAYHQIPVSSLLLLILVKATFKLNFKKKRSFDNYAARIKTLMQQVYDKQLKLTTSTLHPSVVSWPVKMISKYGNPEAAIDLLETYNKLFLSNRVDQNNKLVYLKSLMIVAGESEKWNDFESLYGRFLRRVEYMKTSIPHGIQRKQLSKVLHGIFDYKIQFLKKSDRIEELPHILFELEKNGLLLSNHSWNLAIIELFGHSSTIKTGLKIVDERFIHGYNLIHKLRLLKTNYKSTNVPHTSSVLQKKKDDPKSFKPKLYLKSATYKSIFESLDVYLNQVPNISKELKSLIASYPYFMKNYLMHPRGEVKNWSQIESDHEKYLRTLRSKKRIVSSEEF